MSKQKKYLPHVIAFVIFLVISFAYLSPVLSGKRISMSDVSNNKGMAKESEDFYNSTGTDPLWTGSMFSGMPTYQISLHGQENFADRFMSFLRTIFPDPTYLLILNLLGFYFLLITLKVDYRLAIAGSIMYAFCTYTFLIIKVGHISKVLAIAFAPVLLAGIIKTLKGNLLQGFVITLFGVWMEITANHYQMTYYFLFIVAAIMIAELIDAIRSKKLSHFFKACGVMIAATCIAVIPNLTNLWSTYVYSKDTTRGPSELSAKSVSSGLDIDYATDWSYGIEETLTLLIPDAKGASSDYELSKSSATYQSFAAKGITGAQANSIIKNVPTYWGDVAFTAGPVYIGAITVFLFILGLFVVKSELKWWLLGVTVLTIMLSWGRNFMGLTEFFFFHVPGYNKFRAVSSMLVVATLVIPWIAMLAVKRIAESANAFSEISGKLKYAFYISGGICLLFFLMPSIAGDFIGRSDERLGQMGWPVDAIREDRISMLRMSAFYSLLFISIAFGAIWFYLKKKFKVEYLYYILIFFTLIDMWSTNRKYLNNDHFVSQNKVDKPFPQTNADLQIAQDPDPNYRVFNTAVNPFMDASTSYYHKSIGGYHGAKLKRYQELIENQISKNNIQVLNMLNAKYFIGQVKDMPEPQAQRNPGALGHAWFVKEIKWVPNADSEMNALTNFNPAETAVIDKRFEKTVDGFTFNNDSSSTIKLNSYKPNALDYESNTAHKQLAVFSEIYFDKGWNAYVDGKKSDYFRVNYVLRGMVVPEGKHNIQFKFEPEYYYKAQKVATAGSVLASLIMLGYLVYYFKKKSNAPVA